MVGKKVAVVTNLAPRKICGVESQGMILAAMDDKNNLSVMTVDKDIIAGSEIGQQKSELYIIKSSLPGWQVKSPAAWKGAFSCTALVLTG